MTADYRLQAIEDSSALVQELYRTHAGTSSDFPHFVAEHFSKLFESETSFQRVINPALLSDGALGQLMTYFPDTYS